MLELKLLLSFSHKMLIIDQITRDLNWRESELGSLKVLLTKSDISEKQKSVLLRASWTMLYAHYEGFCKFCLTVFYDEVCRRVGKCGDLPEKTRILALDRVFKSIRNLPPEELLKEINEFHSKTLKKSPEFPEVNTDSNLWPDTLIKLLSQADITSNLVLENVQKIKILVKRRNSIAHGERNLIEEVEYYHTYETAVYEVMYDLAFLVDQRLGDIPYVKSNRLPKPHPT